MEYDKIDLCKPWDGGQDDAIPVAVEMWYDRSRRHWVVYPVDADGNQLKEAEYGFGKAEAMEIKKDLELAFGI